MSPGGEVYELLHREERDELLSLGDGVGPVACARHIRSGNDDGGGTVVVSNGVSAGVGVREEDALHFVSIGSSVRLSQLDVATLEGRREAGRGGRERCGGREREREGSETYHRIC